MWNVEAWMRGRIDIFLPCVAKWGRKCVYLLSGFKLATFPCKWWMIDLMWLWFCDWMLFFISCVCNIRYQLKLVRLNDFVASKVKGINFSTKVKNMCENDFYIFIHRYAGTKRDYCECRKTNNRWVDLFFILKWI